MKNISCRLLLCLAFSIASLFMVRPGDATLGQPADSVESDRIALSAVRGGTTMQNGYEDAVTNTAPAGREASLGVDGRRGGRELGTRAGSTGPYWAY